MKYDVEDRVYYDQFQFQEIQKHSRYLGVWEEG